MARTFPGDQRQNMQTRLFIGGEFVDGADGANVEVLDPHDCSVLAEVAEARADDVDRAVVAAATAFPSWAATPAAERGRLLLRLADAIEDHADELARLESTNTGHPLKDSAGLDVPRTAATFRYFGGIADKVEGAVIPVDRGFLNYVDREPLGVVGQIVPWNFPLMFCGWKLGPALAAGNTVVLKPSELTPLTSLRLAELLVDVGLPPGVVNMVPGYGRTAGQHLAEHPDVAKIAFTGSTEVGAGIARGAADTIKRVTLELGGKSANVVFADADVEAAAAAAPYAVFDNSGQDCCARSRIFVEKPAVDDFMAALEKSVKGMKVGDPLDEKTEMGPLISAGHLETVSSFVPDDAPVAIRGDAPDGPGYWFPPTVLSPVSNDDRAAREEIFGPVACVIPFEGEEEAVRLANDTPYGLSGSIWTRDGAKALRMARAIDTGVLSINSNSSVRVSTPFGGFKQSGIGRELGPDALEHYTEIKNVYYATEEN
jgi:acyl-CoA reductase-like NAD-dependent aldehyde dehydrogenase